jgi:T5SS/PEP-CTERM-associated repeat protein
MRPGESELEAGRSPTPGVPACDSPVALPSGDRLPEARRTVQAPGAPLWTMTLFFAGWLFSIPSLHAQLVNDGATRTLSNGMTTVFGSLTVGTNGSFTSLVLSDFALVTNTAHGVIGRNATARSNEVQLLGPTARWRMAGDLSVGSNGSMNRLVVSDGAWVENTIGSLASGVQSSNNLALVTGAGATWSNRANVIVGWFGGNNQMLVSNGGRVVVGAGSTMGSRASAGGNLATVTGDGSAWSSGGGLTVGNLAAGNRLVIEAGGQVDCTRGAIGLGSGSNNVALVTGAGSVWSNQNLNVGLNGARNRLVVSNGAAAFAATNGLIGAHAEGNTAIVTGAGSRWLVGQSLFVGSNAALNTLVVSNGGMVVSSIGEIGFSAGLASNNLAVVTDPGSVWSNSVQLIVGRFGPGNRLQVINGGRVESGSTIMGANVSSSNITAIISGPGSVLDSGSSLSVGSASIGNRLVLSNGAVVRAHNGYLGYSATSANNEALVTGPGSIWSHANLLRVGFAGRASRLIVTNDGTVTAGEGVSLGEISSSSNNRVVVHGGTLRVANAGVTGTLDVQRGTNVLNAGLIDVDVLRMTNALGKFEFNGGTLITRGADIRNNAVFMIGNAGPGPAVWEVQGPGDHVLVDAAIVGFAASSAQLIHTNGALLTNDGAGELGVLAASRSNSATIGGPASRWWLSDGMVVGGSGSDNRLVVGDGAELRTASINYLGNAVTSSNNEALVTGPDTVWDSGAIFGLRVGNEGRNNRLRIENGARLISGLSVLGEFSAASNNLALITGPGSVWTNHGELRIGRAGSFNHLVVTNGGQVSCSAAVIGNDVPARLNSVTLADPGTRWLITSNLFVGSNGPSSRLLISNGARLENTFTAIGASISSSNNDVSISGAGSIWTNQSLLRLGESGRANQVVVSNGGRVDSNDAEIGLNPSSSNNQVMITGAGSFVRVQNTLSVGTSSSGNRLVVSNGAWLHNDNALIGHFGTNNELLVTGPGTTWTNRSGLLVGRFRGHNRVTIANGAFVLARDVWISLDPLSTGNRLVMDGGTLLVRNSTGAGAIDVQRGTNVLNAGLIDVTGLFVTNALGQFEFNGGTLRSAGTTVDNGRPFIVGTGSSTATFQLRGGTHRFGNQFLVGNGALLTGHGTVVGLLILMGGGTLAPGDVIGTIVLSNSPSLLGSTVMEISSDSTLTNDQLHVAGPLNYGGSLTISNLGPNELAAGDRFRLFTATTYAGDFAYITFPPLPPALSWTNKLLVDGSIEVIAVSQPTFTGISVSGTNVILAGTNGTAGRNYAVLTATNVATAATNWQIFVTNQFGPGGGFLFTNPIAPDEPQRYFRIRTP